MTGKEYGRRLFRHECAHCGAGFYRDHVSTRPKECCSRTCQAQLRVQRRGRATTAAALLAYTATRTIDADKKRARAARRNAMYSDRTKATRRGYGWTGPELELAARADLSATTVAAMIGRTVHAVKHARRGLRVDPRKQAAL